MRDDMAKIVVERPRVGGGLNTKGRALLKEALHRDPEDATSGQAMRPRGRGADRKRFNDHLNPLYRFLRSAVGRPWNKVRADLAEQIRPTSTMQQHVLEHVRDIVHEHVQIIDGKPYDLSSSYGGITLIRGYGRMPALYVHPRTGILLEYKAPKPRRTTGSVRPGPGETLKVAIDADHWYEAIDGIWYLATRTVTPTSYRNGAGDIIYYNRQDVAHRQVGSRELARAGLMNARKSP